MALRIAARVKGGTRAITVQKNIAFNVDWAYNVHLWDTAAVGRNGPGSSVALVAQHQMSAAIADAPPAGSAAALCTSARQRRRVEGVGREAPGAPAGCAVGGEPGGVERVVGNRA